jgi:hypothetical protein
VGKTVFANKSHKAIAKHHKYFYSRKYEQFMNLPPKNKANKQIIQQILTSGEKLKNWKENTRKTGVNGCVIIDIIPEVEIIMVILPLPLSLSLCLFSLPLSLLFSPL